MTTILEVLRPLAAGLVACAFMGCAETTPLGPAPELDSEVGQFVQMMNAHRASVGCPALSWHEGAADVAEDHSEDMIARGFFDHTNPSGESPGDRLQGAGVSFTGWAENIAFGFPTADAVLTGWLNSPGHRSNIENCGLTHHGVGLSGTHWTHVFLRP